MTRATRCILRCGRLPAFFFCLGWRSRPRTESRDSAATTAGPAVPGRLHSRPCAVAPPRRQLRVEPRHVIQGPLPAAFRPRENPLRLAVAALPHSHSGPASLRGLRMRGLPQVLRFTRHRPSVDLQLLRFIFVHSVNACRARSPGAKSKPRGHKRVQQAALAASTRPRDRNGQ